MFDQQTGEGRRLPAHLNPYSRDVVGVLNEHTAAMRDLAAADERYNALVRAPSTATPEVVKEARVARATAATRALMAEALVDHLMGRA